MAIPSAFYSITVRLEVPTDPTAVGLLTTAVGEAGGVVTALDVTESQPDRLVLDLTCAVPADRGTSPHLDHHVRGSEWVRPELL